MSKPVLGFSLDNLDFANSLLNKPTVPRAPKICPDDEKPVHLSNGKTIKLKKRTRTTISLEETIRCEKDSYGFQINELFARLEVDGRLKESSDNGEALKKKKKNNSRYTDTLWAEKWRPRNFMDFVGNESTNRRILHWIKQWDRVVVQKNLNPITTNDEKDATNSKFSDPFGRPERKVLLISGPPGLGKTTVAHVIAKQVGYEVMEINASDERAGQKVKDKVNNSLTTQSFSGKPVCLIADEVDGSAEFGFIRVLLDIINDDQKTVKRFQSSESSKFMQQKGKNRPKFLMRPIICICNDAYVPALEKLRPIAEMISFQQATEQALQDRLNFICDSENLKLTNTQLKEIIHLTDFDIRSSINLLQFGGGLNTSSDSRKKDSQMSWFGIVNELFKKSPKISKPEQFSELSRLLNISTNLDRVVHGCFQAYPDIHFQDSGMSKPGMISDWLFFADRMSHTQFENIGDLSYYQSQVALQFFNQFSDLSNRSSIKIKSDWEYFEKAKQSKHILTQIYGRLSPHLRSTIGQGEISTMVLPYLEKIITPDRKSSFHVKESDKLKVSNAIDAIRGFGLYLNRARDADYNDIYVTYPDFSPITKFEPVSLKKQQQRQTQVFPILLKELSSISAKKRTFAQMSNNEDLGATQLSNIDELKGQYNKITELEEASKKPKAEVKIWVKYHEGFSNAVRKPVKWENLWV